MHATAAVRRLFVSPRRRAAAGRVAAAVRSGAARGRTRRALAARRRPVVLSPCVVSSPRELFITAFTRFDTLKRGE